jgi:hypothetical protein
MRRRQFIVLLAGIATSTWPTVGQRQVDHVRRNGVLLPLDNADDAQVRQLWPAFKQRLGELGWVEGFNRQLEVRFSTQSIERIRANGAAVHYFVAI